MRVSTAPWGVRGKAEGHHGLAEVKVGWLGVKELAEVWAINELLDNHRRGVFLYARTEKGYQVRMFPYTG
jgi:hypothetical protein